MFKGVLIAASEIFWEEDRNMAPALVTLLGLLAKPEVIGALGSAAVGTAKAAVRFVTDIGDGVDKDTAMARFEAGADHWGDAEDAWEKEMAQRVAKTD